MEVKTVCGNMTSLALKQCADSMDPEVRLCGTSFTAQWLLNSLREHDEKYMAEHGQRSVSSIDAVDISKGKGYVSIVMKCTVNFNDRSPPYTTVLKVPGTDSLNEAMDETFKDDFNEEKQSELTFFHTFECHFYEDLAPLLDIPVARVYQTKPWVFKKQEGCLHMEDLSSRGNTLGYFESMNFGQLKSVVSHLAHMHKQVLMLDPQEWHGRYVHNQKAFSDMGEFIGKCFPNFLKITNTPELYQPFFDKYQKFMQSDDFQLWAFSQSFSDFGLPAVLVHGDLWGGNIMYDVDAEGSILNTVCAFVDWQIMHEGSPMADLARYLTLCADAHVRRRAEHFIFDFYYDRLRAELEVEGRQVPFTRKQVRQAYDVVYLTQVTHCVLLNTFIKTPVDATDDVKQAMLDTVMLRAYHNLQDMAKLLDGEYAHLLEKYGK